MASLRARIVRRVSGAWFARMDPAKTDLVARRRFWHRLANLLWTAQGVRIETTEIAGLRAEWLTPAGAPPDRLLLFLHGGAYVLGGCATHRHFVSYIARAAGVKTLLPEYRLAPENPFPAAVDDAVRVYRALLADGSAASNIAIGGDSAGGGLTMATLLALRDAGDRLPAAAFLLSPWLDLTASGESMTTRAAADPWFRPADLPAVAAHYCRPDEFRNPLVSPVYADLKGLPPLFIQVGADEILLSDSTRAADKVRAAGSEVELEIWPDLWHVFQSFVSVLPESREATRRLGTWIRRALSLPSES